MEDRERLREAGEDRGRRHELEGGEGRAGQEG